MVLLGAGREAREVQHGVEACGMYIACILEESRHAQRVPRCLRVPAIHAAESGRQHKRLLDGYPESKQTQQTDT